VKYAIISDIHGHLNLLTRICMQADSERIDTIICLGDIVERGFRVQEDMCITHLRQITNVLWIRGNHDSRQSLEDTAIGAENLTFLESLPEYLTHGPIIAFHSSLRQPDRYLFGDDDVRSELGYIHDKIGIYWLHLYGHTHERKVHAYDPKDGTLKRLNDNQRIRLQTGRQYAVNPGGVCLYAIGGMSFAVLDLSARWLEFRRCRHRQA
jgi:predicted phosphodiesterase